MADMQTTYSNLQFNEIICTTAIAGDGKPTDEVEELANVNYKRFIVQMVNVQKTVTVTFSCIGDMKPTE